MLLPLLLLPIFAGLFWFVVVLPQRRVAEAHAELVASLERGQEIVTVGGLHGRIVQVDGAVLQVEVAPSLVVRVDAAAVSSVVPVDVEANTGPDARGEAAA